MTAKPRSAKTKSQSALLEALSFCGLVTSKEGASYETHVALKSNCAFAFNGVLAAGAPITEDLFCYAHNELLVAALSRCDDTYSLTQLSQSKLSIKSGKFKAVVPCLDPILINYASPDPQMVAIDDRFKDAVQAVGVLADENEHHVLTASVLMNGPTVIATNRKVMFEAHHGLDLPPNVPLPKQFVAALVKSKKKLTGFGYSKASATFYFEGDYWLRTQLYADEWPDVSSILNKTANLWPIDENFFKGLEAVAPFSEDGNIYFDAGMIRSHEDANTGAEYAIAGVPKGVVYPAKQLALLKGKAKSIDYNAKHTGGYCLVFIGDTIRGTIMGQAR